MASVSVRGMAARLAVAALMVSAAAGPLAAASLTLYGEGRAAARPDMAMITTGAVTTGKTAQEALAANSKAVSDAIAALKGSGIDDKDVRTSGFSIQPQYNYPAAPSRDPPRLVGYEVRNMVTVKVRDLTKLGSLLDVVIQSGANQASGLSFMVGDSDKLEQEARTLAVKDAIAQAQAVAGAAGLRLTRITSLEVRVDGGPVRPGVMMMKADAAARMPVPVEAGETEVTAHATLVYEAETP